ncbi:MAG: hypothetical protein JXA33_25800 [Anaerolineae bacterium]|nr:hypothetical protein [Anaerolineae bacterium]
MKIQLRAMLQALFRGAIDTVLFISLPITISIGTHTIWTARYHLTSAQQQQVEQWANISRLVAYIEDVPPVVPLVLWFKEGGLRAENPTNCEGIMGLHTAVTSGELPCFPAGPISAWNIAYQLQLGARTFKNYCPEVTYTTTNPNLLKRCYLYYNAGPRTQSNPNDSGYVMNGYDAAHQNMILTDISGRRYRLQALGAWPIHLAIQAQLAQRQEPGAPAGLLAPIMLGQEVLDKTWTTKTLERESDVILDTKDDAQTCRSPEVWDCFILPHTTGNTALRPAISPLLINPKQIGDLTCGLLPGIDLAPETSSVVLAPLPGYLTRYTDEFGHLAIRIENEEWTVWITGLRSYAVAEGKIEAGQSIGVISGLNSHSGLRNPTPSIHYTIYDNANAGFVDPLSFVPADVCISAGQSDPT